MKTAPFHYHAPTTVGEAVRILADVSPNDGRILAGGQTLVPAMAFRVARPSHLVDINGIEEFQRLEVSEGKLRIGACIRHAAFHRAVAPGPLGTLLTEVVHHIAHHPIRTRGTFCGSLANADPASEWCTVATCLGAEMVATSVRGSRTVSADQFFKGIMTTALADDEILSEVRIPLLRGDAQFGFYEFNRRAGDFAVAMALAVCHVEDGRICESRLAIGGAESQPRRMVSSEAMLEGQAASPSLYAAAASRAAEEIDPMEDAANPAEFRRDVARTAAIRALGKMLEVEAQ